MGLHVDPSQSPGQAQRDSSEVRFVVIPPQAQVSVDGQFMGTGRFAKKVPVGPHMARYSAPGCRTEEVPITVVKGELLIAQPVRLSCEGQ